MMRQINFVILGLLCSLYACRYDNLEDLNPRQTSSTVPDSVSYSQHIAPILNTNCISCHSIEKNPNYGFGNRFGVGVNLASYEGVSTVIAFDNQRGYLIENIKRENSSFLEMPRNATKLRQVEIETIERWINQGFPNN